MNDCWKRLGLVPTTDLKAIKRAYRAQVKRYHPDTVTAPELKRRYTVICAAINDAYREAVRQAQTPPAAPPLDDDEPFADEPEQDESEPARAYRNFDFTAFARHRNEVAALFRSRVAQRRVLRFFFGFLLLAFFAGQEHAPTGVVTLVGLLVALFVGSFIFGLLTAGAMDLLIFWFFPRRLLYRLGLAKYESRLIWVMILAANTAVFFFTRVIPHPDRRDVETVILDVIMRAAATITVPMIIAVFWLRDLKHYRKL
ncbi:MAG TPA: DnaJ domain-containing protein [Blastocatellia bacterium]|nr:DnaJ domain-containing protein [Blastocatellia bacterium]